MSSQATYPLPSASSLTSQFLDRRVQDLPTPAVVLDRSKLQRHCSAMLSVCATLSLQFRAHVKSHKTLQLAAMQVGASGPANFVVSTVMEAERLGGYVGECQRGGRESSVSRGFAVWWRGAGLTDVSRFCTACRCRNPVCRGSWNWRGSWSPGRCWL
jgi:hypothetical protein